MEQAIWGNGARHSGLKERTPQFKNNLPSIETAFAQVKHAWVFLEAVLNCGVRSSDPE
jgi:hypothetical protein